MSSLGRRAVNSSKTYSNKSFKTNEDSNFICNVCKASREDLLAQNAQLKDKAHQSFMQVLQIQQLHEEQLCLMRDQWNQREQNLVSQVASLSEQLRVLRLQMNQVEKNVKRHSYDFGAKELIIDNIESIGCEDNDRSYLDESALIQFKDLLAHKNGSDYVANLRNQIYRDFKFVSNNKMQIQKLFMIIKDFKNENSNLGKVNELLKEKLSKTENMVKEMKVAAEGMKRENTFISQNLKRLTSDKMKLQKKISDLERVRSLDEAPHSPYLSKLKISSPRQQSSEKELQVLQQASELSITKREINQLNYAKFMMADEIENDASVIDFNKKKSLQGKLCY